MITSIEICLAKTYCCSPDHVNSHLHLPPAVAQQCQNIKFNAAGKCTDPCCKITRALLLFS